MVRIPEIKIIFTESSCNQVVFEIIFQIGEQKTQRKVKILLSETVIFEKTFLNITQSFRNLSKETLNAFGEYLFKALLLEEGQIDLFTRSLALARSLDSILRIRIDHELTNQLQIPFELMRDINRKLFLSRNISTSVIRSLNDNNVTEKDIELERPISVLALYSADDVAMVSQIKNHLDLLESLFPDLLITKQYIKSQEDLWRKSERYRNGNHQIFYLISHGKKGSLSLEQGEISEEYLHELLVGSKFQLAYINACSSAEQDINNNLYGICQRLIQAGCPAVIGMQRPINVAIALKLAEGFFSAFLRGTPIDQSISEMRLALDYVHPRFADFAVPVLYLQTTGNFCVKKERFVFVNEVLVTQPEKHDRITRDFFIYYLSREFEKLYKINKLSTILYKRFIEELIFVTKLSLLLCDNKIVLPPSSVVECNYAVDVLKWIPEECREIIWFADSTGSQDEYFEKKLIQYPKRIVTFYAQASKGIFDGDRLSLFDKGLWVKRLNSRATKDISRWWKAGVLTGISNFDLLYEKMYQYSLGSQMPSAIERLVFDVPEKLERSAFITDFVLPFITQKSDSNFDSDPISKIIFQFYIQSYILEYKLVCMSQLQSIDCIELLPVGFSHISLKIIYKNLINLNWFNFFRNKLSFKDCMFVRKNIGSLSKLQEMLVKPSRFNYNMASFHEYYTNPQIDKITRGNTVDINGAIDLIEFTNSFVEQ